MEFNSIDSIGKYFLNKIVEVIWVEVNPVQEKNYVKRIQYWAVVVAQFAEL